MAPKPPAPTRKVLRTLFRQMCIAVLNVGLVVYLTAPARNEKLFKNNKFEFESEFLARSLCGRDIPAFSSENVGEAIRDHYYLQQVLELQCRKGSGDFYRLGAAHAAREKRLFSWLPPNTRLQQLLDQSSGRGIAMPVYDGMMHMALTSLRLIREKSALPVEVFYLGDSDLAPANQALLRRIPGVTLVDLSEKIDTNILKIDGWVIKPFALLMSSFKEAVLMDADATFLLSPDRLFEEPEYARTGSLFFYDKRVEQPTLETVTWVNGLLPPRNTWGPEVRSSWIIKGISHYQQESGVVLIDKARAGQGLAAACLLLDPQNRAQTTHYTYGDKETYWLGMAMVGLAAGFNPVPAGLIGVQERDLVCGSTLIHFSHEGEPFWLNGGTFFNKRKPLSSPLIRYDAFAREDYEASPEKWLKFGQNFYCMKGAATTLLDADQRASLKAIRELALREREAILAEGVLTESAPNHKTWVPQILPQLNNLFLQTHCMRRGTCVEFRCFGHPDTCD